jgi:hypothetical protein
MFIDPGHPLRKLFDRLVQRRLFDDAQVRDRRITGYVSGLLTDFTHSRNLYRIRNAQGRRLEDVGEMLIASNPLLEGRSFDWERAVRKHIGDYTLFLSCASTPSSTMSRPARNPIALSRASTSSNTGRRLRYSVASPSHSNCASTA